MPLKLITDPTTEPISLDEAKAHLRVTDSARDTLIGTLIAAARQAAEHELGRRLITQTWEWVGADFPVAGDSLGLGVVGVLSPVESVKYLPTAGAEQTLSSAAYTLVSEGDDEACLVLNSGYSWPDVADLPNAVRVRFTCGYGPAAVDVPATIRQWMLLHIGTGFANPESVAAGLPLADLPGRYHASLLDPHRVYL